MLPSFDDTTPILHLSIPVDDLDRARQFYVDVFGATPGRREARWADVWFFAMQVTLQLAPDESRGVPAHSVRHFGVTVDRATYDVVEQRIGSSGAVVVVPTTVEYPASPFEQRKTKIADPAGNVIEIKTYPNPRDALLRAEALED